MMTVACLGDSLTEGDYGVLGKRGIADVRAESYPYFLGKMLGAEVRNFGKCGYTATSYLSYYKDGKVDLCNVDVIIIMLGTNGGQDDRTETQANRDYRELVRLCMRDAPNAKTVICTPPHVTSDSKYSNCGYAERVDKAAAFVRDYAAQSGLAMIDVALCPAFTQESEHIMQPNDGLHFSLLGYRTLARYIADGLKNQNII